MDLTPSRLTLARKRRGMTKKALAKAVDISVSSLTAYEAGKKQPRANMIVRLANELRFPLSFFGASELDEYPHQGASFRALSRMTARQRDQALAAGVLAFGLADWIENKFNLPDVDVPKLRGIDPETAAEIIRKEWGLGEKSISNMVHLLEAKGVRVFSLAEECVEVDAWSCWRSSPHSKQNIPFVFLNTMKTAEHSRMDAAHELGHLVLHWGYEHLRSRALEHEANMFASAFLMPEARIKARAPFGGTLDQIKRTKHHWGVSTSALIYRMHKLQMLSDWQYRSLFIELGPRKKEHEGIEERETSLILAKIFNRLRSQGISRGDVAKSLCLPIDEFNKLVFRLVLSGLNGGGEASTENHSGENYLSLA